MKTRSGFYVLLIVAVSVFFLVACNEPSIAQPEMLPEDSPTPVSATPLPPGAQMNVDDFVNQQEIIDQEWDQIHAEFDQWSADLTSCHPNSMREALNDFAVSFNSVTEQARDVTRSQSTGQLADTLIAAAEEEEAAFRRLRDRWQPNNVSLFEDVEQRRSQASHAQKNAEDLAIELQKAFREGDDPESLEEFNQSFDVIDSDWKALHEEYSELRDEAESLEVDDVYSRLEELAEKLADIVDALDELPDLTATERAVKSLGSAAEAELEAFKITPEPSDDPEPPDFDAMDASVEKVDAALKATGSAISSIAQGDPGEGLAEIQVFNDEYAALTLAWDGFHDRYNDWRMNEGGCDRAEVMQELDQFSLRIGSLGRGVRDLPQSGYLLPMYSLLVEAVGREENVFRTLRNSWQPHTVDAFKAVDRERINTNGLRREADIILQELRNRS